MKIFFRLTFGLMLWGLFFGYSLGASSLIVQQGGGSLWTLGERVTISFNGGVDNPTKIVVRLVPAETDGLREENYLLCQPSAKSNSCVITVGQASIANACGSAYKIQVTKTNSSGQSSTADSGVFAIECPLVDTKTCSFAVKVEGLGQVYPASGYFSNNQRLDPHAGDGWELSSLTANGLALSDFLLTCESGKDYQVTALFTKNHCPLGLESYPIGAGQISLDLVDLKIPAGSQTELKFLPNAGWSVKQVFKDGLSQGALTNLVVVCPKSSGAYEPKIKVIYEKIAVSDSCSDKSAEQTLADLRLGQKTFFAQQDFRTWAKDHDQLIRDFISETQCLYATGDKGWSTQLGLPDVQNFSERDISLLDGMNKKVIRENIEPLLKKNLPAMATIFLYPKQADIFAGGFHAIVVTGFSKRVLSKPKINPTTVYTINYLDPTNHHLGQLVCQDTFFPLTSFKKGITCQVPDVYRSEFKAVVLISLPETKLFNDYYLSLSPVRKNSAKWLENNYLPIINYGIPASPQGVCLGWSDFHIRSAILSQSCPALDAISVEDKKSWNELFNLTIANILHSLKKIIE